MSNKPTIPTVPTNISSFTNDAGYLSYNIDVNSHDYVDLGLPSGTLWATMNIGANDISDYGTYYQYGKGSAQYDVTNGSSDYSGTENPLALNVDTANRTWGGDWHMPTESQLNELIANTTSTWTTINGINGRKFIASNGNYIFFPAAGRWANGVHNSADTYGHYWTSSPYTTSYAYLLYFSSDSVQVNEGFRNNGFYVRGVIDKPGYIANKVAITGSYNDLTDKPTIPQIWSGTQAQYDLLTPDSNTIYIITSAS